MQAFGTGITGMVEGTVTSWLVCSGLRGPGSSPGQGHCVVFLDKTLFSLSASLHAGIANENAGVNLVMD